MNMSKCNLCQNESFKTTKWNMIKSGKKLEELPAPYNKGFNIESLWSRSRYPNFLLNKHFSLLIFIYYRNKFYD